MWALFFGMHFAIQLNQMIFFSFLWKTFASHNRHHLPYQLWRLTEWVEIEIVEYVLSSIAICPLQIYSRRKIWRNSEIGRNQNKWTFYRKNRKNWREQKTFHLRFEGLVSVCVLFTYSNCLLFSQRIIATISTLDVPLLTKYTDKISNDHTFIFFFSHIYLLLRSMWTIWTMRKWCTRRLGTINGNNNKIKYIQIRERGLRFSFSFGLVIS